MDSSAEKLRHSLELFYVATKTHAMHALITFISISTDVLRVSLGLPLRTAFSARSQVHEHSRDSVAFCRRVQFTFFFIHVTR